MSIKQPNGTIHWIFWLLDLHRGPAFQDQRPHLSPDYPGLIRKESCQKAGKTDTQNLENDTLLTTLTRKPLGRTRGNRRNGCSKNHCPRDGSRKNSKMVESFSLIIKTRRLLGMILGWQNWRKIKRDWRNLRLKLKRSQSFKMMSNRIPQRIRKLLKRSPKNRSGHVSSEVRKENAGSYYKTYLKSMFSLITLVYSQVSGNKRRFPPQGWSRLKKVLTGRAEVKHQKSQRKMTEIRSNTIVRSASIWF